MKKSGGSYKSKSSSSLNAIGNAIISPGAERNAQLFQNENISVNRPVIEETARNVSSQLRSVKDDFFVTHVENTKASIISNDSIVQRSNFILSKMSSQRPDQSQPHNRSEPSVRRRQQSIGSNSEQGNKVAGGSKNKARNEYPNHDFKLEAEVRKCHELEQQVECFKSLLIQMAFIEPKIRIMATQLMDPRLKKLSIFSVSNQMLKSPQDSLLGNPNFFNVNNCEEELCESDVDDNGKALLPPKTRKSKRGRRGHRVAKPKSQQSQKEALKRYINSFIGDHLRDQLELAEKLKFEGDFDDLEEYAQKLVAANLGRIVEEVLRVNRKNNRQAFITMSTDREGTQRDGIITMPVARRYAFEGDRVRAFVMNSAPNNCKRPASISVVDEDGMEDPLDSDTESDPVNDIMQDNCPKAFVISIVQETPNRQVVGVISFRAFVVLSDGRKYYRLRPYDMRIPIVHIPIGKNDEYPANGTFMYLAQVSRTMVDGCCIGELLRKLGTRGELKAEIESVIIHNGLDGIAKPYDQRFIDMYAERDPPISADDMVNRKDLRKMCIFTIDPLTARDLDDAVSIEPGPNNTFTVGVHISDVSLYLQEGSELDDIVKDRATSVYLVNSVIHMLPETLCMRCSLLPGVDKFAFSVFWTMDETAKIIGEPVLQRTLINSCAQLAYEHAQAAIDGCDGDIENFPTIYNGYTMSNVTDRIRQLNNLARVMRTKRFDNGALSINNPKIRFTLDPTSGNPTSYEIEERGEANFLIEEFMLLANQTVARFIYDHFPDISILRNHAPPLSNSMKNVREKLESLGFKCDFSSSKAIYASMQSMCKQAKNPAAMDAYLCQLLTKPMARAKYFCSDATNKPSDLWHYALSIPIYTHFTSPIRRYPDILVHRLLSAALDYTAKPNRTPDELQAIAKVCNDQKFNAKNAGDESANFFFTHYVRLKQSIILPAVVLEMTKRAVNVVTLDTGHCFTINLDMQKVMMNTKDLPQTLVYGSDSKVLRVLSTLNIKLTVHDNKLAAFLMTPAENASFLPDQKKLSAALKIDNHQMRPITRYKNDNGSSKIGGGGGPRKNGKRQSTANAQNPLNGRKFLNDALEALQLSD